jgi:cell division protein FtsB
LGGISLPKQCIPAFFLIVGLFYAKIEKIFHKYVLVCSFFIPLWQIVVLAMGRLQQIVGSIRDYKYTKYIVTLFVIVLIVGFVDDNSIMNRQERIENIEKLQTEIAVLKAQYEDDTRKLNELEEYDNVVRLAREKYLMKRPGEDVFVIRRQFPPE